MFLYLCNLFGFSWFLVYLVFDTFVYSHNPLLAPYYFKLIYLSRLTILVSVKVPSVPVFFWLPEAHVEISWIGSVILAAIILKYSLLITHLFCFGTEFILFIFVSTFLFPRTMSLILFLMCAIVDIKVFGAHLSIFHMNLGMVSLLFVTIEGALLLDFVWVVHSLNACFYFWVVGSIYNQVGARIIQSIVNTLIIPVLFLTLIFLVSATLGCPLGLLFLVEIIAVASLTSLLIGTFLCMLNLMFYALVVIHLLIKFILAFDSRRNFVDQVSTLFYLVFLFAVLICCGFAL